MMSGKNQSHTLLRLTSHCRKCVYTQPSGLSELPFNKVNNMSFLGTSLRQRTTEKRSGCGAVTKCFCGGMCTFKGGPEYSAIQICICWVGIHFFKFWGLRLFFFLLTTVNCKIDFVSTFLYYTYPFRNLSLLAALQQHWPVSL